MPHEMHERKYRKGEVRYTVRSIDVADWGPDFNGLADVTMQALDQVLRASGHCYINPAWTVQAPASVPHRHFLACARKACIQWMRQVSQTIGTSAKRRMVKRADDRTRRLVFGGILFLDGKLAHPKRMHQRNPSRSRTPR